jgi:hypothetical protein
MCLPERLGDGILTVGGNAIGNRSCRTMCFTCAAIEPTQTIMHAGQPNNQ